MLPAKNRMDDNGIQIRRISLDDLYRMVAHIYSERNAERPASVTFAHFVEVCGMLSIHERPKKKENLNVQDALCKALGWFFPLMAKFNVESVEELVFRKYPLVCPYCRRAPHEDAICKSVKGTSKTVNHDEVLKHYQTNSANRPVGLNLGGHFKTGQ